MDHQNYSGVSTHFNNVQPLDLFIMSPIMDKDGKIEEDV